MITSRSGRINRSIAILLLLTLTLTGGCVYYNTFYNARKSFNEAESARKKSTRQRQQVNTSAYKKAIEKAMKVVEYYPGSKYYDDALYVLTVSYFYTEAYSKSERRARELLANYPKSKYVKEASLYLAKAKLMQGDVDDAMQLFQEIFEKDYDNSFKAEAAMGLSNYHIENKDYARAQPYLLAIRDSLGSNADKRTAQRLLAEAYFNTFRFAEAQSAALQLLGMNPDRDDRYFALHTAATCSYRLQRIAEGHDYLRQLMTDEVYFDSLGVLELLMASGYEDEEDLAHAEALYKKVVTEQTNPVLKAEAYWRMGLMNQFEYDDLPTAKGYYDSTARMSRATEIGQEALQRSADIGKLEEFALKVKIDSSSSQDLIDQAAYTQIQLAELYWFQLDKADSAINELRYVAESFPTAFDAPKALIALSAMIRETKGDSTAADSILRVVPQRYPHSDYVAEALGALGLKGTEADTGYAELYIKKAENFLVDQNQPDSALHYYKFVVDHFPDSKYYLQARFACLWVTENYESPGDSSLILAYDQFVDSFPGTYWATLASERTKQPSQKPPRERFAAGDTLAPDTTGADTLLASDSTGTDSTRYVTAQEQAYLRPDGERLQLLPLDPIEVQEPFVYPTEAYRTAWYGDLYFQILLDFSGKVSDYVLVNRAPHEEINRRAEEAVAGMTFDPTRIPDYMQGKWVVFKFAVRLPEQLR